MEIPRAKPYSEILDPGQQYTVTNTAVVVHTHGSSQHGRRCPKTHGGRLDSSQSTQNGFDLAEGGRRSKGELVLRNLRRALA